MGNPEQAPPEQAPHGRGIYCNRTLNLRAIKAVGFDMDYTLVHYKTEMWERRAYEHAKQRLIQRGWPMQEQAFDPSFVMLGLVLDLQTGNIVKTNRFGYIVRACHGGRFLDFEEQRRAYAGLLVDLSEPRWSFMNTLFALSEGCLFAQAVTLRDKNLIPEVLGYGDLYRAIRMSLDESHLEGELKAEIVRDPDSFVTLDPALPLVLQDLAHSGKKLLLITNSEWDYTHAMMSHVLDRFLRSGQTWRDLFDVVIVSARKPSFFLRDNALFEVIGKDGLLRPVHSVALGGAYHGGNAALVEKSLGLAGEEILYVGDHIFADVHVSKDVLRWRTALVVRELEQELAAIGHFHAKQEQLTAQMAVKVAHEQRSSALRLDLQRLEAGYGPQPKQSAEVLREELRTLRAEVEGLDQRISPLAKEANELNNPHWGLLMRAGNDKSNFARQIERYADIYMSRVSNFQFATPFTYLRAPRGSLPHDEG